MRYRIGLNYGFCITQYVVRPLHNNDMHTQKCGLHVCSSQPHPILYS